MRPAVVIVLALALAISACAPRPAVPRPPTLEQLRASAARDPRDPVLARAYALAEVYDTGADPARAEAALERALGLTPNDPALVYTRALLAGVHGRPSVALDGLLRAIELAAPTPTPQAQALVEVASYALAGQSGMVRGHAEQLRARLTPLLALSQLSTASRGALSELLVPLAYRRGDRAEAVRIAAANGCRAEFRVAGPFGPRELLGFDADPPVDPNQPLADVLDLGPGRGPRATRKLTARACSVHLGGGPVPEAGISLAETQLEVPRAGDYVVRLDTPNSVELFIDGRSQLRVDRRRALGARVVFHELPLSAGKHHVVLMVASRHPNPVLQLAFSEKRPADDSSGTQLLARRSPPPSFELHLRVTLALARGDALGARQALAFVHDAKAAAPVFIMQRASVALGDPLVPDEVRGDDARRLLARAAERDPRLWSPTLQLATLAAQAGRVDEAIDALRKAGARWPEVPAFNLALVELLRGKGLFAAADHEIARLRELLPDACGPIAAELESNRLRQRYAEVGALAQRLVACDAESNALFAHYSERRDYAEAKRELARLATLSTEGERYGSLMAELQLAKSTGDDKAQWAAIHELRSRYPRSVNGALEELDALLATGRRDQAREALEAAVRAEPGSMAGLHRVSRAVLGEHPLAKYRKDGLAAIKAFEASGKAYDGPQLLLLDYMATRIYPDGSALELVHTVQRAQSDEAVNELGEVQVPEGAEVLTLRSIKPDGRTLEADTISGKDAVSLPSLSRGDYVEFEYLRSNPAPDGFPGGYLGDRFFFKSFEVPFHHSQMLVLLPKQMPFQIDPRGAAPAPTESTSGELRVLDFAVDESVPLVEEPSSVSAREFIPSVRIGSNTTFPALIDSLRDVLADRDLFDPYFASLVRKIIADPAAPIPPAKPQAAGHAPAAEDLRLRAERLYSWVLANIENNNDVFSQAALMLRARSGNRARVLHYLLQLAGVPSRLALGRSSAGDATQSDMADGDTYEHLLVRVDLPQQAPIWLFTSERWAPFGFMPSVLRGQPALLLEAGAPPVKISDGLLGPDSRHFAVTAKLRSQGSATVDVVETLHGGDAVAWRQQLEQIPVAELNRRIEQDYVARLFPGASLVSLEITGREQHEPDLKLHYVAEVVSFGRPVAGGVLLAPLLPSEMSANMARTATRKTTELIPTPVRTSLEVTLELPPGLSVPTELAKVSLGGSSLGGKLPGNPSFAETLSATPNTLRLQRSLSIPAMRVEPALYPALTDFCRKVDAVEGREILLPAAALRAGWPRE